VRWSCKDCNRLDPHRLTDMTKVVLQMRAALAKDAAPRQTVSPGSRMGDFGQDAGGMVHPDDDYEDEWSPPPAADNENELTRVRSQAWHPTPEAYRKSRTRCPRQAASGERRQRTTKRRKSTAPASRLASESLIL